MFENDLENNPQYGKHMIFTTESSRQGKPRNTLKTRFLKNLLCVFRDWKDLLARELQAEP